MSAALDVRELRKEFSAGRPAVELVLRKQFGLQINRELLNVNGGAIALGHPLGSSGTKLMTTLVNALKQRNKRYGLQTMCEGGGMANVTIVERL